MKNKHTKSLETQIDKLDAEIAELRRLLEIEKQKVESARRMIEHVKNYSAVLLSAIQ